MLITSRKAFYDEIRQTLLHVITEPMVQGIEAVFDYWEKLNSTLPPTWIASKYTIPMPVQWLAYILATVYHETAHTFQPINEYGGARTRYAPYWGRGFVQLTWLFNYVRFGKLLGIDLVNHPELALELQHALDILFMGMIEGLFSGHKLSDWIEPSITIGNADTYTSARIVALQTIVYDKDREIVNGMDRAPMIAGYALQFETALIKGMSAVTPNADATMKGTETLLPASKP